MDEETVVYTGITSIVALIAILFAGSYGSLGIVAVALGFAAIVVILLLNAV